MPKPFSKKRQIESESDEEPQVVKKSRTETKTAKTAKTAQPAKSTGEKSTDADGNTHWELGKNRRISSSQFKGVTLVNIREYYTAPDGELKPGKKGISLSLDQYKTLLTVIPELNEQLRSQGHDVDSSPASGSSSALVKAEKPEQSKKPKKSNIEATSDEEEEGDDE